ncbi:unnamed protein product [Sphagnum compactum]
MQGMNLKWKVSRVSVSIAGRSSASTRSWNQYLCTTTVVLGWTQDEHFLEDDLLLDSGFGSSITKMGPQMECWVGGCTGQCTAKVVTVATCCSRTPVRVSNQAIGIAM